MGYARSIPYSPEAAFLEITLSQDAFELTPYEGSLRRRYDFDLTTLTVERNSYAQSGRFVSKEKRFAGEPRRFSVIPDPLDDLSDIQFRLILKPGESPITLDPSDPLQILSSTETSLGYQAANTVVYSPVPLTQRFGSTDLSGRAILDSIPYIDREKVRFIASQTLRQIHRQDFDPNASTPYYFDGTSVVRVEGYRPVEVT